MEELNRFLNQFSTFLFESLRSKPNLKEISNKELILYCDKISSNLHSFVLATHVETESSFKNVNTKLVVSDVLEEVKDLMLLISCDYEVSEMEKASIESNNVVSLDKRRVH